MGYYSKDELLLFQSGKTDGFTIRAQVTYYTRKYGKSVISFQIAMCINIMFGTRICQYIPLSFAS